MTRNEGKEIGLKRKALYRGLIVLGVMMVLAGISLIAGTFAYLHGTDRRFRESQQQLLRVFEEDMGEGVEERKDLLPGDAVARIWAPSIGLDAVVVELGGLEDIENLKRGPGHVPGTALPGEPGNCVISGHRTTYGAPFRDIDRLKPGDPVILQTKKGLYEYRVSGQRVVVPEDLRVLEPTPHPTLSLTACHPRFSASRRLVVTAELSP